MRGPAARVYLKIVRSTSRRKRLRPTRAYIRTRRSRHESESHQDVRPELRRRPRWRNPGRVRRPRERRAGHDEVLPHVLDAISERPPRKPEVRVLHARAGKGPDPRADGLHGHGGSPRGRADRDTRHGKHPQEPELPPGPRQLARVVQDVLQERDESGPRFGPRRRFARRARDDGEDARPPDRTLLPLRVAAGPRPLDPPDFGETTRLGARRLVAGTG